ncbi:hypothetical protein PV11_03510 [Exophiala sideris]|uniref:Major facilitator superfamily (MFS) profile domain-containing protein n=1 Tax=Exophiala sideris TaxID=1016849 RepID=A0A0D1Z337_9EURO|nr:hypothetical protein PV11_03510 [Exophiala sideris]
MSKLMSMSNGLCFWVIPIGANIGASVSDASKAAWLLPTWNLCAVVGFLALGTQTDLFGRKVFIVGGSLLVTVGYVVMASTPNVGGLQAGMVVLSVGAACVQFANFTVGELLPNKWRHIGVVMSDYPTTFATLLGPVAARVSLANGTWRWMFGVPAILEFLCFAGLAVWYHPPRHPRGVDLRQGLRDMDYTAGIVLFSLGVVLSSMGLVYVGLLPSSDPHVIAFLTIGFSLVILFALWETFGNPRYAIAPPRLFKLAKGRAVTFPLVACAMINMTYFSCSIIWPTMISVYYTKPEDWRYANVLSLSQGLGIGFGAILLSILGRRIKHWNWQLTIATTIMVAFGAITGGLGAHRRKATMVAFTCVTNIAYAWAIYLAVAVAQLGGPQHELGVLGGLTGAFRAGGGVIASSVYGSILSTGLKSYQRNNIPEAARAAGLPNSQIPRLLSTVGTADFSSSFSNAVVAAVESVIVSSYTFSLRLLAFSSIGFGVVGIIACALTLDINQKMNDRIEVRMEKEPKDHPQNSSKQIEGASTTV